MRALFGMVASVCLAFTLLLGAARLREPRERLERIAERLVAPACHDLYPRRRPAPSCWLGSGDSVALSPTFGSFDHMPATTADCRPDKVASVYYITCVLDDELELSNTEHLARGTRVYVAEFR